MAKVEIYTTAWCPFCIRAKMLLDHKGVSFEEYDAPRGSQTRDDMRQRSGRDTVPQIFIDDQHIGGCDDLFAAERSGQLDPLLNS